MKGPMQIKRDKCYSIDAILSKNQLYKDKNQINKVPTFSKLEIAIPFEIKSVLPDVIQLRARGFFKWCLFLISTRFFIAFFEF